jgi:hypothetical protein
MKRGGVNYLKFLLFLIKYCVLIFDEPRSRQVIVRIQRSMNGYRFFD